MRKLKIKLTKKSICKALIVSAVMILPALAFANDNSEVGNEASTGILALLRGGMGQLACMIVFALAVVRSAATQSVWPFVGGLGVPVAIHYGPDIMVALGGFNGG